MVGSAETNDRRLSPTREEDEARSDRSRDGRGGPEGRSGAAAAGGGEPGGALWQTRVAERIVAMAEKEQEERGRVIAH